MERLGDIIDRTVKRLPLRRKLDDYALWTVWDDTVGPAVARNAQPEKIRNGTLFVRVRAATWMQQLQYMKDILIDKLNQRLEREVVTNIFFVMGEFPSEPPPEASRRHRAGGGRDTAPGGGAGSYRGSRAPELLETTVAEPTEETGLGSCIGRRYDPDTGGFETRPYTGCPVGRGAALPPTAGRPYRSSRLADDQNALASKRQLRSTNGQSHSRSNPAISSVYSSSRR